MGAGSGGPYPIATSFPFHIGLLLLLCKVNQSHKLYNMWNGKCVNTTENIFLMLIYYNTWLQYLTWIMPEQSDFLTLDTNSLPRVLQDKNFVVICNNKILYVSWHILKLNTE